MPYQDVIKSRLGHPTSRTVTPYQAGESAAAAPVSLGYSTAGS